MPPGSVSDSTGNDGAGVSKVRGGKGGGLEREVEKRRKQDWLCHALRL